MIENMIIYIYDREQLEEFPDETSPVEMEEGVNDRKNDKNEKNDEEKQEECPYDTPPVDIEESGSARIDDNNEKNMREKRQNA